MVIGVELFDTIKGLLSESRVRAELVLLVAVTAVSRELIVFNYESADGMMMVGLGVLIAAVAVGVPSDQQGTLEGEPFGPVTYEQRIRAMGPSLHLHPGHPGGRSLSLPPQPQRGSIPARSTEISASGTGMRIGRGVG